MCINDKVLCFMYICLDECVLVSKYAESFKKGLADSAVCEKEREAKAQLRRQAAM